MVMQVIFMTKRSNAKSDWLHCCP